MSPQLQALQLFSIFLFRFSFCYCFCTFFFCYFFFFGGWDANKSWKRCCSLLLLAFQMHFSLFCLLFVVIAVVIFCYSARLPLPGNLGWRKDKVAAMQWQATTTTTTWHTRLSAQNCIAAALPIANKRKTIKATAHTHTHTQSSNLANNAACQQNCRQTKNSENFWKHFLG